MATKRVCDYCDKEIRPPAKVYTVSLYTDKGDNALVEKDACSTCKEAIRNMLGMSYDRINRALAASD